MSRILAIDYGNKRTGLAIADPLSLIASGLETIATEKLMSFLKQYIIKESLETVVIGEPKLWNNHPSYIEKNIQEFIKKFCKKFPAIHIERIDERFTSKIAQNTLIIGRFKKKMRQNKALIDKVSAILILQTYLDKKNYDFTNNSIWKSCIEKKK